MDTINIPVSEYYDNPKYYPYMSEDVFNELEAAFLYGEEFAEVLKADYEKMINDANGKECK
jgi:hypothetical protein